VRNVPFPRDACGNLIEGQHFRGGAIPITSPYPEAASGRSGAEHLELAGFTDDQIDHALLTEGHAGDRPNHRALMPPFRMSGRREAIIAWLRSR
jgi:hypothetical protein